MAIRAVFNSGITVILFKKALPINFNLPSEELSYIFSWINECFKPNSFKWATILCTEAEVEGKRKEPVSVISPVYKQVAISRFIKLLWPDSTMKL